MKIPKAKVTYFYTNKTPLHIRYGRSWDGKYFFEVVTLVRHGCGQAFSSRTDKKWVKFMEYLEDLNVEKRLKLIDRVLTKLKDSIINKGATLGTLYKFKKSTLFKEIS